MRPIYITTAANDRDLRKVFEEEYPGVSFPLGILHGDASWDSASGWDTEHLAAWEFDIKVCGDRKKVPDLLACIDDGRHLNQIRSAYEAGFSRQFLVVEGMIKEGPNNTVVQRKNARPTETTYSRLKAYLHQIQYLVNVQVIHTRTVRETVHEIFHLYTMFQTPPEDHDSLKKFYVPPYTPVTMKPSLMRRFSKELAYISWDRSKAVEKRFDTIQEMANATEEDWMDIPGFGEVIARSAVRELQT